MINLFTRRGRKSALLLSVPALAFALLNTAGLTQTEQAENSSVEKDYEEVFSADDTNGVVYINWLSPKTANDSSGVAWFLGAYVSVAKDGDDGVSGYGKLCIDIDRSILTNNVRYAIHYTAGDASALYLKLLDTNGAAITEENLFGDLLTSSNVIRYVAVAEEAGTQAANTVLLVDVPTAKYPEAAVIQLWSGGLSGVVSTKVEDHPENSSGTSMVLEGLLYVDEDGDYFTAEMERRNGSSDYSFDGNGGSVSNYCDWSSGSSSSTNGSDGGNGGDDEETDSDKNGRIIYVDKAIGNDTYTGRTPLPTSQRVGTAKKGPKKTVRGGLAIAGTNDTIIIRSGTYNENLNISGKDIRVIIEGKVKL